MHLDFWSFVLIRKTLLNQRPKPHDCNFCADFTAESTVFGHFFLFFEGGGGGGLNL